MKLLYEGKAKQLFEMENKDEIYVHYKNSATAFNGEKYAEYEGKGRYNNLITSLLFQYLKENGIHSHFIRKVNDTDQICERVKIIPLEVIVHNKVAGSMAKRYGLEEGLVLKKPVIEFSYKNDALGDPMISDDVIEALEIISVNDLATLKSITLQINELLKKLFTTIGFELVDFKVEFGINRHNEVVLADEISPDTCRLWDLTTGQSFDKDRFRRNLGQFMESYEEVLRRLEYEIN